MSLEHLAHSPPLAATLSATDEEKINDHYMPRTPSSGLSATASGSGRGETKEKGEGRTGKIEAASTGLLLSPFALRLSPFAHPPAPAGGSLTGPRHQVGILVCSAYSRNIRHLVVVFVMSMLCVSSVAAQEQSIAPKAAKGSTMPVIHRATVDSATNQITVEGVNFGDTPIVEIEGVILTLVSNTPTHLVAQLPEGLPPASYLLKVIANSNPDSKKKVLFEVTIGALLSSCPSPLWFD